ncbi:MAG TPA: phage holin family protein [Pyrinomonadaceae bacterium]|nr:phage holin family protein [Pyrinomonadaceae bacterium]
MAATKKSLMNVDATAPAVRSADNDNLPNLFSRLGDDVMQLFNSQLALFKVEIKEEASAYARGAAMIAFGAAVAVVGFALLNVAIAFAVSTLFAQANFSQPASYALGFVVTGGFYLLVGAIVILVMKSRLARHDLVPQRSIQELRKEKQWLKNEL